MLTLSEQIRRSEDALRLLIGRRDRAKIELAARPGAVELAALPDDKLERWSNLATEYDSVRNKIRATEDQLSTWRAELVEDQRVDALARESYPTFSSERASGQSERQYRGGQPYYGERNRGHVDGDYRGDGTTAVTTRGGWLPTKREYRELETRAVGASGSVFVPVGQATEFVDRLRARSIILGSQIPAIACPNGTLRLPKNTTSVTVSTTFENVAATPSDPGFGASTLLLRKLIAITIASNEAMSDSMPALREVIGETLARDIATAVDAQFLTGNGVAPNMLGVRNWAGVTAGPSLGVNGSTLTLDHMATALTSFEAANGSIADAVWVMNPRTWGTLRAQKDSQNRYQVNPVPGGAEERSLFGIPVLSSTNVPITETIGTSAGIASWVALIDQSQVRIGYGTPDNMAETISAPATFIEMASDLGVSLAYSDQFAFNADQTTIRVTARFDIVALNAASTVLITGVLQ